MRGAAFVLLLAACEPAIEVRLVAPADGDVDLSCVTHVSVVAFGNDATDGTTACIEVDGIRSLRDHGLDGKLAMDLPASGLAFLEVRGVMTAPDSGALEDPCLYGATMFAGVSAYDGGEDLPVRLVHALDCAARSERLETVRVVDLIHLVETGECAAPSLSGLMVGPGVLWPTQLSEPGTVGLTFSPFSVERIVQDGVAQVPLPFADALAGSCIALNTFDGAFVETNQACIDRAAATACAAPGELELAHVPMQVWYASAAESDLNVMTIVAVVDATTRRPIQGATIDRAGDVDVEYASWAQGAFLAGATAVPSDGVALVYTADAATITVRKEGYRSRTVRIGNMYAGAAIVALEPL